MIARIKDEETMPRIEIRPYDGNLKALRNLAYRSWMAEYKDDSWPDVYTPAIAQYYFEGASDPRLIVGAYLGEELVGFVANYLRTYRFRGRHYGGVISSSLVISPEYPGVLGIILGTCLKNSREFGSDFALMMLEKGHKTIHLAKTIQRSRSNSGPRTHRLVSMPLLIHAIDMPTIIYHESLSKLQIMGMKLMGVDRPIQSVQASGIVRPFVPSDLPETLALIEQVSDRDQLVRIYDLPTLERRFNNSQLSRELGGMIIFEDHQQIKGFISYSIYNLVNKRGSHPWAHIDLICWESCTPKEKWNLISGLWEQCKIRECLGILLYTRQRMSHLPFYKAGFLLYPRPMDLQVGYLRNEISLEGVGGVFEQIM
jgi:hypothetical protein